MSTWVVALFLAGQETADGKEEDVPERISDNEKGDVLLVCVVQDGVAVGLDHVPVGENDGPSVERFLERQECRSGIFWKEVGTGWTCQTFLVDHEDAGVDLEVDPGGRPDGLYIHGHDGRSEAVLILASNPRTVMSFSSQSPNPIT